MAALPLDDFRRIIVVFLGIAPRHEYDRVADGGQRVPELMGKRGQEVVFLPVVFLKLGDQSFPILLCSLSVGDVHSGGGEKNHAARFVAHRI